MGANLFSRYLWELGQYEDALDHLSVVEQLARNTIGANTLAYARTLVVRGSVYSSQNAYHKAGPLFNEALDIRKTLLPSNDHMLANSYMQMGNFYTAEGDYAKAASFHKQCLDIRRLAQPPLPLQMVISYYNLSRCLVFVKDLAGAKEALKEAEEWERALPTDHDKGFHKGS